VVLHALPKPGKGVLEHHQAQSLLPLLQVQAFAALVDASFGHVHDDIEELAVIFAGVDLRVPGKIV
jgi:hypothetical protein